VITGGIIFSFDFSFHSGTVFCLKQMEIKNADEESVAKSGLILET
jgi:hypothetical protein